MDTYVSISIYLPRNAPRKQCEKDLEQIWQEMSALDSLFSNYRDDNEISAINKNARKREVAITQRTLEMLKTAQRVSEITNGAFDVTVGSLTKTWGFGRDPTVPTQKEIDADLESVGFRFLQLDTIDSTIKFSKRETRIDVGGIAKGAIIDAAYHSLQARGYRDFLIDAGGDLRMAASGLTSGKRNIWVVHPRRPGEFLARFPLDNGAVATTGDYERFFVENGKRFHHIIDPSTGYPSSRAVSATVVAPNATMADAFATAFFILGPKSGIALAEKLPDIEAMIVFEDNQELHPRFTQYLANKVEILNNTSDK
ncbi:MAG: FAD:protein FMN transferase [bacterium]